MLTVRVDLEMLIESYLTIQVDLYTYLLQCRWCRDDPEFTAMED